MRGRRLTIRPSPAAPGARRSLGRDGAGRERERGRAADADRDHGEGQTDVDPGEALAGQIPVHGEADDAGDEIAEGGADDSAHCAERARFDEEDPANVAVPCADRLHDTDVGAALAYSRHHRVGDSQRRDPECDQPDGAEHDLDDLRVPIDRGDQ